MQIYGSFGPNPRALRMFLAEKDMTIPTQELDIMAAENRRPPYTDKNPGGQLPALELDDPAVAPTDQLVPLLVLAVENEPLHAALEVGEHDRAGVPANDVGQALEQLGIRFVDPDVDLAAAGEADTQREVVRDPVRQELAGAAA